MVSSVDAGACRRLLSVAPFKRYRGKSPLTVWRKTPAYISTSKPECDDWRKRDENFRVKKDGELLFETPHISAFNVSHFAESRVGFYFKDLDEYGLYGFFAGNDDDVYYSYYHTDRTFKKEEMLLTNDED